MPLLSCGTAIAFLLGVGIIVLFVVFIQIMSPDAARNYEKESKFESKSYTFNPDTVLELLDQGNKDIFTLQTATPEAPRSPSSNSVSWHQADYFRIAQTLFQQSWHEPFEALNLYSMYFSLSCTDTQRGAFNEAHFLSYKVIENGKEDTRIDAHTYIYPSYHQVVTFKGEYTPDTKKYEPIDLMRYRISAEEALQIADKNGGAEKRLKYENDCEISIIAPGGSNKGWNVTYSHNQDKWWDVIFEIYIDPETGEFTVHD